MKKRLVVILLLFISLAALGHSGKAKYHVIIDTDGGIDDLRAISMLLASKEVEVIGINCSDGILSPWQTASKVQNLLSSYHHEGIPIGRGNEFLREDPRSRDELSKVFWGDSAAKSSFVQDNSFLKHLYEEEAEKITMLCLASLNSISIMYEEIIDFQEKTERIIWFIDNEKIEDGFNYLLSPVDFEELVHTEIPLTIIQGFFGSTSPLLDELFWSTASDIPSRYAANLARIHSTAYVKELEDISATQMRDDIAGLYLLQPEIFNPVPCPGYTSLKSFVPANPDAFILYYLSFLEEKAPDFKVFRHMPLDGSYYASDLSEVIQAIISKYGMAEWRAGVLTNELHGHLGIYSIIGMKMGIRAREYYNIGLDDLRIASMAGQKPPISCMNDGLQVSTGSTLGHGLFQSDKTNTPLPEAVFSFKGNKIMISLKQEYVTQIRSEVRTAVEKHGLGTDAYWANIRELAIAYWLSLDRNQLFTITIID